MHILLLNEYYPPDTSATAKMAVQVAETLAKNHQVTVVAGRPSYDPDEFYPYQFLRRDTRNGVVVERVGSTAYPRHQMKRRVSNYLSYLALAVPRALALRPDVVLAMTDPPVAGIAGAFVARLAGRPFVYNIRDLYPDMAIGGDIVPPNGWAQHWEKMHRKALKRAACVIVLGDDMRERILAKGVSPERVVVVRDGTSFPASMPERSDPVVQEIRGGFPFVALHAGNLGFYGAWGTLLKAAEILRNENTGLVFVGSGANRASLEASASGSPNVRFLPFRPFEQVQHVMMAGDVHIVTIKRGLEGVVVPSKLYSILAAGRPVLAVAPESSDAARIVVESGCGLAADPDDPAAVAAAIRELRNDPARLHKMGCQARATAEKYARVNELQLFSGIIEKAVLENNGGRHLES
ncbi:MAG TPA: glycosyltransferase family 4 protein [Rhizomicrobium sp.]|jgi:colanic acid biosynthesis glycosyl transferase WcaI|nr:glycosyltransferase family 4 protein [Rhizomicrobium sp.]